MNSPNYAHESACKRAMVAELCLAFYGQCPDGHVHGGDIFQEAIDTIHDPEAAIDMGLFGFTVGMLMQFAAKLHKGPPEEFWHKYLQQAEQDMLKSSGPMDPPELEMIQEAKNEEA